MGLNQSKAAGAPVIKRNYLNKKNSIKYVEQRIVQNFILIWLDANIDATNPDCQYTMRQLQQIVNCFATCTTTLDCQHFIEKKHDEQIFLIVSGRFGKDFVPIIHENNQLDSIYIFCGDPAAHMNWTTEWKKIKLVSNQIELICQSLAKDVVQCEHDSIPTSILTLNDNQTTNLQQIDHSFMYSQLLKEILLDMTYDTEAIKILLEFCRTQYVNNTKELKIIDEFENEYSKHTPIWWYTRECFTYGMLNHSLRLLDIDIIAMMGFFMKDIHQQISEIYSHRSDRNTTFVVFRGQRMSQENFEKVQNNINGLFTFNSFLSTSIDRDIAMKFSRIHVKQSNKVSVLFVMEIDPTITKTPFASLNNVSCYGSKENEILFSMHTVFRIIDIKKTPEQIWEIKLKSVSDNDLQITRLTEQIRREIGEGSAVHRLCQLMINLGELDKADVLLEFLNNSILPNDQQAMARIYNQQGYIKYKRNQYDDARSLYQKASDIQEKLQPVSDLDLAMTYNNIGLLYTSLKDTQEALKYHQKALVIREKRLNLKHPDLATTYNNIGLIYDQLKDYTTALKYYEKTMNIYQYSLPPNHPWLATLLENIGLAEASIKRYDIALNHLQKAWEIRRISLPENDPSIASICNNIGDVYQEMNDYKSALSFYENALKISKNSPERDSYTIAMIYHDMSKVHNRLNQYNEAVKCAEQAVAFGSKILPSDHHDLLSLKKNLHNLRTQLS